MLPQPASPSSRFHPTRGYDPAFRVLPGVIGFHPHPSARLSDGLPVWAAAFTLGEAPAPVAELLEASPVLPTPTLPAPVLLASVVPTPVLLTPTLPAAASPAPTLPAPVPAALVPVPPVPAEPDQAAPASPTPSPPVPASRPRRLGALYRTIEAPPPPVRRRRWPAVLAVSGLLAVLAGAAALLLPGWLAPPTIDAVFSAPILKLRAVGPGLVSSVSVAVGQPVEPGTLLLTLHADHLTDAVLAELWTRLERAQTRQALAGGDPRQASATGLEIDQLQRAIATASANATVDLPVRAGVNGTVWALDAQPGARTAAGDLLVQLADCGRAFVTLGDAGAALKPGSTVLVRMSGLPAFHGTVRPSAGPTEPAGTLVVTPTGFAAVAQQACPVGASATVQPGG